MIVLYHVTFILVFLYCKFLHFYFIIIIIIIIIIVTIFVVN